MSVRTLILGGGRGTRLYPLTKERSKPAVPLAGKFRLIDIPVSNCINSGMHKIFVATQFNSQSLNRHLSLAYRFDTFSRGFVDVLAAEQTEGGTNWFQGTADAVRQCLSHIGNTEYLLILSGDHLYRMDYAKFLQDHIKSGAVISIATKPVTELEAPELGLMKINEAKRIVQFKEKPSGAELNGMRVDTQYMGMTQQEALMRPFLGSMGIYIFNWKVLRELLLDNPTMVDFGKEIIPVAIDSMTVNAYCFDGYWADIGSVKSFYDANLELVKTEPQFTLHSPENPIYFSNQYLPSVRATHTEIEGALLSDGAIIKGSKIVNSVIGQRSRIEEGCIIEDSVLMGADFYKAPEGFDCDKGRVSVIDSNVELKKCIVDKNVCIGRGVKLTNKDSHENYDDPEGKFFVREGITIVPKNADIPEGFEF